MLRLPSFIPVVTSFSRFSLSLLITWPKKGACRLRNLVMSDRPLPVSREKESSVWFLCPQAMRLAAFSVRTRTIFVASSFVLFFGCCLYFFFFFGTVLKNNYIWYAFSLHKATMLLRYLPYDFVSESHDDDSWKYFGYMTHKSYSVAPGFFFLGIQIIIDLAMFGGLVESDLCHTEVHSHQFSRSRAWEPLLVWYVFQLKTNLGSFSSIQQAPLVNPGQDSSGLTQSYQPPTAWRESGHVGVIIPSLTHRLLKRTKEETAVFSPLTCCWPTRS